MKDTARRLLLQGAGFLLVLNLLVIYGYAQDIPQANTSRASLPIVYNFFQITPTPPDLLISEVFYDPSWEEPDGEWVELFNPGGQPYPLTGVKLGDAEAPGKLEGMYSFPPEASLAAGETMVVASRAAVFRQHFGQNPDYELSDTDPWVPELTRYTAWSPGSLSLVNSGDEMLLLDGEDQVLDAVSWGSSYVALSPPARVVPEGHSLERLPASQDTDRASDWTDNSFPDPWQARLPMLTPTPITEPTPASDQTPEESPTRSTPQAATATVEPTITPTSTPTPTITPTWEPTPAQGRLLISEVLYTYEYNEPASEWIELFNAGGRAISLDGMRIGDQAEPGLYEGMVGFPAGARLEPGQVIVIANHGLTYYYLFGRQADFEIVESAAGIANMIPDRDWGGGSVSLSNDGDEVVLIDGNGRMLDSVSWGTSSWAFYPPVPGVREGTSLERYPPGEDHNTAEDWRYSRPSNPGVVPLP